MEAIVKDPQEVGAPQRKEPPAKKLGQYTLEEKIGEGGMGEVYRASHAMLRRPTAVKLLRPEKADGRGLARFEQEVQLTSRLTHPNTVEIYDYGRTPEGIFYYAMEYLPGLTLAELVRQDGPQSAGRTIHILKQVCASLVEAHGVGLIHCDIKPANIILCERGGVYDVAKVVDFGLVKDIEHEDKDTVSFVNSIRGTPLYLSPESIHSERIDARSDLYGLGAVGYYLITARPLFESKDLFELCNHHLQTRPEPPSSRLGGPVPSDLEGLLLMCLEKEPAKRPLDAKALYKALNACKDANTWTGEDAQNWWLPHGTDPKKLGENLKTVPTKSEIKPRWGRTAVPRSVEWDVRNPGPGRAA